MQNAVAILIACLAAAYLLRRTWLHFMRGGQGKCGSCPSCGHSDTIKSRPLVTISLDQSHAEAQRTQRG